MTLWFRSLDKNGCMSILGQNFNVSSPEPNVLDPRFWYVALWILNARIQKVFSEGSSFYFS